VAPLFRRMSQEFERLVYGLNQVKNELEEMQHPITRQTNEFLM
jgi:division protein CdvB (Snf7/Vps24/ESCRT-III family)